MYSHVPNGTHFRRSYAFSPMKAIGNCFRLLLRTLCAVEGAALHTLGNASCVQSAADDVVTYARQVTNLAATDQNHRVLLQVVANTGNVSRNFHTVGQTHTGDLTKCGVRLLGAGGTNSSTYATLLGGRQSSRLVLQSVQTSLQSRGGGLVGATVFRNSASPPAAFSFHGTHWR